MNKKLLFALPIALLLAACSGNGGKGSASIDVPTGGAKKSILVASEAQIADAVGGLNGAVNQLENSKALIIKGKAENINVGVSANMSTKMEDQTLSASASVNLKNFNAEFEMGVDGFRLDGQDFAPIDMRAYETAEVKSGTFDYSYNMNDTAYSLIQYSMAQAGLPFELPLKNKDSLSLDLAGLKEEAYLINGNAYLNADFKANFDLVDKVLEHLDMTLPAGLDLHAYSKLALKGMLQLPDSASADLAQVEQVLTTLPAIIQAAQADKETGEMIKSYLDLFHVNTYFYDASSDYCFGITATIDKAAIGKTMATFSGQEVNVDEVLAEAGVTLSKFSISAGIFVKRNAGIELSLTANAAASMKLAEGASAKANLSGKVGLEISLANGLNKAFPSASELENYIDISGLLPSRDEE